MKTFKQMRIEGWFDKKEKEDPDYEELEIYTRQVVQKETGK